MLHGPAEMTFTLRIPERICETRTQPRGYVEFVLSCRDEREGTLTRVKFVRRLPGAPPDPLPAGSTATRGSRLKTER